MKKKNNDKKKNLKVDKGIHRQVMLDMGLYNIHKEKAFKSKKSYTRKPKHKGKDDKE